MVRKYWEFNKLTVSLTTDQPTRHMTSEHNKTYLLDVYYSYFVVEINHCQHESFHSIRERAWLRALSPMEHAIEQRRN